MSSASEFLDWMRRCPRKAGLLAAFTGGSVVGMSIIVVPYLFQTLPVSWRILLRTAGALFWWGVLAVIFGDLNPVRLIGKTVFTDYVRQCTSRDPEPFVMFKGTLVDGRYTAEHITDIPVIKGEGDTFEALVRDLIEKTDRVIAEGGHADYMTV